MRSPVHCSYAKSNHSWRQACAMNTIIMCRLSYSWVLSAQPINFVRFNYRPTNSHGLLKTYKRKTLEMQTACIVSMFSFNCLPECRFRNISDFTEIESGSLPWRSVKDVAFESWPRLHCRHAVFKFEMWAGTLLGFRWRSLLQGSFKLWSWTVLWDKNGMAFLEPMQKIHRSLARMRRRLSMFTKHVLLVC